MPLPRAVALKAERANELAAAAALARSGQPAAPVLDATPAPQPIPAKPAGADAATLQSQLADTQENLRKANERYDTLRAKYDAEVPRAAAQLREAREKLKTAEDRNTELTKKFEAGTIESLTEEDRQLMGPKMIEATAKIAREVATHTMSAQLQPLTDRVDVFEKMSDAAYWAVLEDSIPDWAAINEKPEFIAWLNQVDPVTQRLRMDTLKRAEAVRQGNRIVEIFRAFKEGREIGAPKPTDAQPQSQPDPLERRTDPPAGGGSQPDAQILLDANGKRIWTRPQIKEFYAVKGRGVYRDKVDEARKIEDDIFAANREGRVRDR